MKRSILSLCMAILMLTVTAECKHHDVPPPLPSQFPKHGEEIAGVFVRSFKVYSGTSVCSMSGSIVLSGTCGAEQSFTFTATSAS